MKTDDAASVEGRARKCIGRTWWLRTDGDGLPYTVALSFEEICAVIREMDGGEIVTAARSAR